MGWVSVPVSEVLFLGQVWWCMPLIPAFWGQELVS